MTTANIPAYVARTQTQADNSIIVINKPAGTAEDDLMIATIVRRDTGTAMTPPGGWTQIQQANIGTGARLGVWYKIAGPSEPTSYTFTLGLSDNVTGSIITVTNVDTANPININAAGSGNSATATAPSVTTTVDNTFMVAIAGTDDSGAYTPPTNYTERVEISSSIWISQSVATYLQGTSGASGTAVFASPDTDWRTQHIAIQAP